MNKIILLVVFLGLLFSFGCGGDDNSLQHELGDLLWSNEASYDMKWSVAEKYCEDMGGRLPTISELRSLIKNCPVTETGGECMITDECVSPVLCNNDACDGCKPDSDDYGKYSILGLTGWFWSSSQIDVNYPQKVWLVTFLAASLHRDTKEAVKRDVICVGEVEQKESD